MKALTMETTNTMAMRRLAMPATLVAALIQKATETADTCVRVTKRKYRKNLEATN